MIKQEYKEKLLEINKDFFSMIANEIDPVRCKKVNDIFDNVKREKSFYDSLNEREKTVYDNNVINKDIRYLKNEVKKGNLQDQKEIIDSWEHL